MSDIKFINEYYELLINKIDESNNRINGFVDDISNELKDCVSQFTENISGKLKIIEYKFNRQSDELDRIKKELEAKKFDEKNFMNVSITMNQAKQIKERDLKIKELEQRIKFIEGKHAASLIVSANAPNKAELLSKPLEVIQEEEVVVSNSVEEPAIQVAADVPVVPVVPATKPKRAPVKKKIEIKKGKAIEEETVVVSIEEEPVVVVEPVHVVEPVIVVEKPKVKGKAKKPTKAEEAKRLADAKLAEAEAALAVEEEVVEEVVFPVVVEQVVEEKIVLPVVEKVSAVEKIIEEEVIEVKITKTEEKADKKADNNINIKYPDIIPNLSDVEVLEYNNNDYYIDTLNNVFQMTADEDIGLFMGIYDRENHNIIMMS